MISRISSLLFLRGKRYRPSCTCLCRLSIPALVIMMPTRVMMSFLTTRLLCLVLMPLLTQFLTTMLLFTSRPPSALVRQSNYSLILSSASTATGVAWSALVLRRTMWSVCTAVLRVRARNS
ncbi:hypothetical protein PBCV1_a513R [Paramecium bursaria Chlorella virus 1]|uniref:Uncharacterized protein n=1 Tax=Paramecium bursaria Chlorella virus 1 TaxID=10506 RepID=Q98563_PBCV1|nr:hypothetical protein PBCV1_a513R [Paramecium bursaria Chlorella virus 1]AAC96880.1 hypothetical protein [Paramecium bursaria Chlorella virus 1]